MSNLFEQEGSWTQGTSARNSDGNKVWLGDDAACCWCLSGGYAKCYPQGDSLRLAVAERLGAAIRARGGYLLSVWNDAPGRTHAEILELCREAGI